ncbi:MAG: hypothetical protein OEV72_04705 [Thermoleophilia bacterium]|nr:hypothetical protein [Thermoleophilia bacterium]
MSARSRIALGRRPRGWLLAIGSLVAAIVATALGAPALGVVPGPLEGLFPWASSDAVPPDVAVEQRQYFGAVSLSDRDDVSFWLVPAGAGGACVAQRVVERAKGVPPPAAPAAFANLNLACYPETPPDSELDVTLDWVPATGSPWGSISGGPNVVVVTGRAPARVTSVTLHTGAGARALGLVDGVFAGRLPGLASGVDLPVGGAVLVGADADGHTVAATDLQTLHAAATPR